MNIKKRVKSVFTKPERKLAVLRPEFRQLQHDLHQASNSMGPLDGIVYFFDVVSKWQDRGGINDLIIAFEEVNYGQYDEILEKLRILKLHFDNAGRCSCGWNRTKRGETVTADKVFLGDIYGLYTHPVSFWKQRKDKKKGGWGFFNMEHLNSYDVVSLQAKRFRDSHTGPMLEILRWLQTV